MEVVGCAAITSSVVASMYVWRIPRRALALALRDVVAAATRKRGEEGYFNRDDIIEIKKRCASLVCVTCGWVLFMQITTTIAGPSPFRFKMSFLFNSVGRGVCPVALLFLGPSLEAPVDFWRSSIVEQVKTVWSDVWREGIRNLFVGPVVEEILFRGLMMSWLLEPAGWSTAARIGISASCFTMAHLHLVINSAVEHCRTAVGFSADDAAKSESDLQHAQQLRHESWQWAKQRCLRHVALVGLFGCLNGYFYETVFSRDVFAASIAHAFCNFFGFPRFLFLKSNATPSPDATNATPSEWSTLRRIASGFAYVAGIASCVAFVRRHSP